ncbi:MAG TPA: tetratricopeptide repeat-containing protein, partial [Myxococcaceae bacterium]|nr:tetratricopeptide repeat-containing protein [Myxococcaceae bacterium]
TLWFQDSLAIALVQDGQLAEGIALEREVVASQRRLLGPEHPDTLESLGHLAVFLKRHRDFDEAERVAREVLAVRLRISGPDHPETALVRYNLACILAPAGRSQAALSELRTAVEHGLTPDLSEHLAEDSDFASLRGRPEFERIAAEAKQRSAKPESAH